MLEQTAGEMTDDVIPKVPVPQEFHRKLMSGAWTPCDEDEHDPVNWGIACGNWGGNYKSDIETSMLGCVGACTKTLVIVSASKKPNQTFAKI